MIILQWYPVLQNKQQVENFFLDARYILPVLMSNYNAGRLGLISEPDISARDISAWTFHHGNFSARGHFSMRTSQHGYFLTPWIFRHMDISARVPMLKCLCQNVYIALRSANMYMCQNVHVPKYPCAYT